MLSWFSFRAYGWTKTIKLCQGWYQDFNPKGVSSGNIAQAVDQLVREVAAQHLFLPISCKERALVGYQILRYFYGLSATLVVGVEFNPFRAHAWVECNGFTVTDDRAHCAMFMPVARYQ